MELNIGLMALGALVLGFSVLYIPIERSRFLSRPILALLLGILVGPHGLRWLDPTAWGGGGEYPSSLIEHIVRLTIAVALMSIALRLPARYFRDNWKSMAITLGLIMPFMWLSSSALIHWVLGIPWLVALIMGAIITPTDPVLSTTVAKGTVAEENLPERIRFSISGESGANDGLAFPFVLLSVFLFTRPFEEVLSHWLLHSVLKETVGAIVLGGVIGWATGELLRWAEKQQYIEKPAFHAYALGVTVFTLGAIELAGMNGILAVFIAGLFFNDSTTKSETLQDEHFQEGVNQFFTVPIFAIFGMELPWSEWGALGWKAVLLVAGVHLFRRLPSFLILYRFIPSLKTVKDASFVGWFGPIGVAAFFYICVATTHTGIHQLWVIGSLMIFSSVLIHGVTAAPLTRWYHRTEKREL